MSSLGCRISWKPIWFDAVCETFFFDFHSFGLLVCCSWCKLLLAGICWYSLHWSLFSVFSLDSPLKASSREALALRSFSYPPTQSLCGLVGESCRGTTDVICRLHPVGTNFDVGAIRHLVQRFQIAFQQQLRS